MHTLPPSSRRARFSWVPGPAPTEALDFDPYGADLDEVPEYRVVTPSGARHDYWTVVTDWYGQERTVYRGCLYDCVGWANRNLGVRA